MRHRMLALSLGLVVLCGGNLAHADSLAERLEQGIYKEQTVGDLDGALAIYQQIVQDAAKDRVVAAEAQFRVGECLLKQEKTQQAMEAFKALIKDFPDQKELVAKAKLHVPSRPEFELHPVPWADGESLQLTAKLATGLEIGTFVLSANTAQENGREIWKMHLGRYVTINAPNQGISRVEADRSTFLPIRSLFRHSLLGTVEGEYTANQVTIRSLGLDGTETTRKVDLDGVFYDNEQGMLLFRRLPLTEDFKAEVPICTTMGIGAIKIDAEVTGIETIDVPAGAFECFRLALPKIQQTFWVSTDEHRYLVKFEAGGVSAVLQSIRVKKPGELVEYHDDTLGFSLAAATEWYLVKQPAPGDGKVVYLLLDPEAAAISALVAVPIEKLKEQEIDISSPRAAAESRIEESQKAYQDLTIRPDSWQDRTLSGQPAVSYIADYVVGDKKMVRYCVTGLGKSTAVEMCTKIASDQFEEFRGPFDTIVDTYQEKSE